MYIIIRNKHQLISHCLIPLDTCILSHDLGNLMLFFLYRKLVCPPLLKTRLCQRSYGNSAPLHPNWYKKNHLSTHDKDEITLIFFCHIIPRDGGDRHWAVYYTSPQNYIIMLSYLLPNHFEDYLKF